MEQRIINRYPVRCFRCGTGIEYGHEVYYNRFGARGRKVRCYPDCQGEQSQLKTTEAETTETQETQENQHAANLTVSQQAESSDPLARAIAQAVQPLIKSQLDAEQIHSLIEDTVADRLPALIEDLKSELTVTHRVEIANSGGETGDCGIQHEKFPLLLKMLQARGHTGHRMNVWLAGPAGTGKTQAVENCAQALGLDYASTGSLTESYKIFGFIVPGTGAYAPTPFRQIWENGGVFLFDDCDGSDPAVLVEFNNALANGCCTFPDGVIRRHADCAIVLTANTWGLGATNEYVGRMRQDAAFLDRFVKIHWDIDESLEISTCPDTDWAKRVQEIRKAVKAKGIKVLVTPRASYYGAALLAAGLSREEVEEATIRAAMTPEQWKSISQAIEAKEE